MVGVQQRCKENAGEGVCYALDETWIGKPIPRQWRIRESHPKNIVLAGPLTRHGPKRPVPHVRIPDATRGHKKIDKPARQWNSSYLNELKMEGRGGGGGARCALAT